MKIWIAPASNSIARFHLENTVENSKNRDELNFEGTDLDIRLPKYFKAWGFENKHQKNYKDVSEGDKIAFYSNKKLIYVAEIIKKITSRKLSDEIWMHSNDEQNWPLIILLSNVKRIDVPISEINKVLGYSEKFVFQSNTLFRENDPRTKMLYDLVEEIFDETILVANDDEFTKKFEEIEIFNNGSTPQRTRANIDVDRIIATQRQKNFSNSYKVQEKIGKIAENVVVEYLKSKYEFDEIKLMRETNNTSPFDIVLINKSFKTMIEVKGTKSDSIKTDFYLSAREYEFAMHCLQNGIPYKLIRVIDVAKSPKVVELDYESLLQGEYITPDTYLVSMSHYDKK